MTRRLDPRFVPELPLVAWGFLLHLVWEVAQSPLYADWNRGLVYLGWTRLHCTAGDVLILLGAFYVVALVFRTRSWVERSSFSPTVVFTAAGLTYTVWSEWYHTTIGGGWEYAEAMPLVFGIGLAPLMQWLIVPPLIVLLIRVRLQRAGHAEPAGHDSIPSRRRPEE